MNKSLSASLLAWLRGFDAAARNRSFTRAAAELNVTQGSISQQVKNLESYLGTTLFTRGNRHLALTADGEELYTVVETAFQDLGKIVQTLRRSADHAHIKTINCSPSFAMLWLIPRLGLLSRAHPEISIRIHGEFHMLDRFRMEEDNIKAGIRFDPGHYTDIQASEFLDEWLIPVATPTFLSAHPAIQHTGHIPSELMLHDACPWDNAPEHAEWNHWLKRSGHTLPTKHTGAHFNLSQLSLTAAFAGQGIAMGRMALVYEDLRKGLLVAPIPIAVKAQAAYHFVSTQPDNDTIISLQKWLRNEGKQFKQQRDRYLQQLVTPTN